MSRVRILLDIHNIQYSCKEIVRTNHQCTKSQLHKPFLIIIEYKLVHLPKNIDHIFIHHGHSRNFFKRNTKDMVRWLCATTFHTALESDKLWQSPIFQVYIASSANKFRAAFHWTIRSNSKVSAHGYGLEKGFPLLRCSAGNGSGFGSSN